MQAGRPIHTKTQMHAPVRSSTDIGYPNSSFLYALVGMITAIWNIEHWAMG